MTIKKWSDILKFDDYTLKVQGFLLHLKILWSETFLSEFKSELLIALAKVGRTFRNVQNTINSTRHRIKAKLKNSDYGYACQIENPCLILSLGRTNSDPKVTRTFWFFLTNGSTVLSTVSYTSFHSNVDKCILWFWFASVWQIIELKSFISTSNL